MSIKWEGEGTTQERTILIETPINEVRQERVRLRDLNEQILRLKADKINLQNNILDINNEITKLQEKKLQIKTALKLTDKDIG